MNIGIIVYSQTGNTFAVAQKLKEKLDSAGHSANIDRVTITGEATPGNKNFQLITLPAVDQYDALIFGSPVQAFSLHPAMIAYPNQLSSLQGKKIACFVTKQLPFYWTGGNRAIAQMKKICESKGAAVCGTEIVVWSKSQRDHNISRCIESLSSQIAN
ncbi:MAG: flavodoxin [Bacillota bacterium]|nr:flavodoxin [Bacillota bacterium]